MSDLIFKLINLARDFSQKRTVSIYELLQQAGYMEAVGKISDQDIYRELVAAPDFADDWLEYSEDKRTSNGWYYKQTDNGKYLVGYVDESGKTETEYDDKIKACSKFIKQELDAIGKEF
jgi:hypothetical protein